MANDLTGRRARWEQLQLDKWSLAYSVFFDVLELFRAGYPKAIVRRIWHLQRHQGMANTIAFIFIKDPSFNPSSISELSSHLLTLAQFMSEKFESFGNQRRPSFSEFQYG